MKKILTLLAPLALLAVGCSKEKQAPTVDTSREITIDDLVWVSEWQIHKWKLSDLTDKKIRQIQLVLLNENGEITKESITIGTDTLLDLDMEIALAFREKGEFIEVKLRGSGGSTSSTIGNIFKGNTRTSSPSVKLHNDLLVIATDSSTVNINPKSELENPCNKLCLRFIPFRSQETE